MIFGYARVSTKEQQLERQTDALAAYACDEILTEKLSGTKSDRPELTRLMDKARAGDTLVVESWSRLGRSLTDLLTLIRYFTDKGVALISIKEDFDTGTPQGKLMLTLFSAMAEFERDLIAQRTREGLAAARARGRKGGRPRKKAKDVETALKLYRSREYSIKEISGMTGISSATLYRYLKESPDPKL